MRRLIYGCRAFALALGLRNSPEICAKHSNNVTNLSVNGSGFITQINQQSALNKRLKGSARRLRNELSDFWLKLKYCDRKTNPKKFTKRTSNIGNGSNVDPDWLLMSSKFSHLTSWDDGLRVYSKWIIHNIKQSKCVRRNFEVYVKYPEHSVHVSELLKLLSTHRESD